MANLNGFNASDVDPNFQLGVVPAGTYVAVITDSEMKPNSKGTGHLLYLTFQIVEGEYAGRKVWTRLNLDHPNPTAMEISKKELSAICRAVGVLEPKDSVDLHDIPLVITARVEQRKNADKKPVEGEFDNKITAYEKKTLSPAQPAQAPTDAKPWLRK
jgi:hypothetical protein